MKKILSCLAAGVLFVSCLSFFGCNIMGNEVKLEYPEEGYADADTDSWKQIDPDDEDVEITWWVDNGTTDFYQLESMIYKKTGVKVNFVKATTNDGTELATMMSNNTLYDIITITDYSSRVQLADEGYVYPIDELAKRYAPTLLSRITDDFVDYYAAADGHIYGLANNYYSDADIAEYKDLGGNILCNNAIVARKDYLEAYLEYKHSQDPDFDEDAVTTTPDGFLEMCNWVKEEFSLANNIPVVCLSPFPKMAQNGSITESLTAIMEYFCVPKEDEEGNLVYEYGTERFLEVLEFFNAMYRDHLIIDDNFSYSAADVNKAIKNGYPFVVIGGIQNYSTGFANYSAKGYDEENKTFSDSHEYVPIAITNKDKEAPLLMDMGGRGLRISMITNRCKRVDRVIKMFDYLVSEEGQRDTYYGVDAEGIYYNFKVRPGETAEVTVQNPDGTTEVKQHKYTYGLIEWTDEAKSKLGSATVADWYNLGIKQISLLTNPLYVSLTSVYGADMDNYQFYLRYKQKAALIPYTFSRLPFRYPYETEDMETYYRIVDIQAELERLWVENFPSFIKAGKTSKVREYWEDTLAQAKAVGYEEWLDYQNECFKKNKEQMNISYGWPMADPEYIAPEVRLQGYPEYNKEMPEYIRVSE